MRFLSILFSPLIFHANSLVIHESIEIKPETKCKLIDKIFVKSYHEEGGRGRDPDTYLKDAALLEELLKEDSMNSRYRYYLGISYMNAKKYSLAIEDFQKRVQMQDETKGDSGEVYASLYFIGSLLVTMKASSEEIIKVLTEAYLFRPWRAEPLYELARYFVSCEQFLLADLLLEKAQKIPFPSFENYFLVKSVYDWRILFLQAQCAYRLGRTKEALEFLKELLSRVEVPEETRNEAAKNITILANEIRVSS